MTSIRAMGNSGLFVILPAILALTIVGCAQGSGPGTEAGNPDAGVGNPGDPNDPGTPDAGGGGQATAMTLSESTSDAIVQGNSVGCMQTTENFHFENSYYRVFDLDSYGISGTFEVNRVRIGIEAAAGASGSQPASVALYTLSGALTGANLTPIGEASVNVTDMSLAILDVDVRATAPGTAQLVVEFHTPDGVDAGNVLVVGSNDAPETSPTYVRATDCGLNEPASTSGAEINAPQMHWVVEVEGTHVP